MEQPEGVVLLKPIEIIPIKDAVACAECNCISIRQRDGRCVSCGSESIFNLVTVLGEV